MNKVILIGRLTRDPELRHTPNGAATCTITVAIDRVPDQNGQRTADFIPVVTWNKQAENIAKYLTKGRLVAVDGRIQTRNYENKEGNRVYVTEVIASSVQFLESKNSVANSTKATSLSVSTISFSNFTSSSNLLFCSTNSFGKIILLHSSIFCIKSVLSLSNIPTR